MGGPHSVLLCADFGLTHRSQLNGWTPRVGGSFWSFHGPDPCAWRRMWGRGVAGNAAGSEATLGNDRQVKMMRMRYAGTCGCGTPVPAGARAGWDGTNRVVICLTCLGAATGDDAVAPAVMRPRAPVALGREPPRVGPPVAGDPPAGGPVAVGTPGASLQQEYRRRSDARSSRIRTKHPKLGGLILALTDDPASTTAFAKGAAGEESVAKRLEKDRDGLVLFLHNRLLGPGRRDGDLDHIAIAPSGVYIIDAKHYKDATVEVRRIGGLFSPRVEKLFVAGRDRSKLLDGLDKQVSAVAAAMASHSGGPIAAVTALLCFVDANLPLFRTLSISGVPVLGPRGTSKMLRQPGPLDSARREALQRHLADCLPPA
jgi:hypothetical protein